MAARRGRTPNFTMTDTHRVKIQNSNTLRALIEHVEGKRDMKASQVTAALGLLNKVMPNLQSVSLDAQHSGEVALVFKTVYEEQPKQGK